MRKLCPDFRNEPEEENVDERLAFSVTEFCALHSLSRARFYSMLNEGTGPRVMKCGTRTLISVEAAQEWRRERERETAQQMTAPEAAG